MAQLDPASLKRELEYDWAWRTKELDELEARLFAGGTFRQLWDGQAIRGTLWKLPSDKSEDNFCRTLVVMLYAHFEGACKQSFVYYASALNSLSIRIGDAKKQLAAATLSAEFQALADLDRKNSIFKRILPEDKSLHSHYRRTEFIERYPDWCKGTLSLNTEEVCSPQSNLNSSVLRKVLYRLGFDHSLANEWVGTTDKMLGYRNGIAHGTFRKAISKSDYFQYRLSVEKVIIQIHAAIIDALHTEDYLRPKSLVDFVRRIPNGAPHAVQLFDKAPGPDCPTSPKTPQRIDSLILLPEEKTLPHKNVTT